MDDYERDEPLKKDNGGVDILKTMFDRKNRNPVEKGVLEYNNKEPEGLLEQFMLPKERIARKGENPESDDVEFDYSQVEADIMKKIDKSDFKEYAKENVKERGSWGKKLTIDQILSYSKTLHGPILKIPKEVESLALKNFKRRLE